MTFGRADVIRSLTWIAITIFLMVVGVVALRALDPHLPTLRPSPMSWSQREYAAEPPAACPGQTVVFHTRLTITVPPGKWLWLGRQTAWKTAAGPAAHGRRGENLASTTDRIPWWESATFDNEVRVAVPDLAPGVYYYGVTGVTEFSESTGWYGRVTVPENCGARP